MNQLTFSDIEYANRKKKTKREEFLDSMDLIIPWEYWIEMIRPYYYKNTRGRRPIGIETMLRMYLMQVWFNLSDEGIEDAIYDSYAMRTFMHLDFNEQQVPDATTLLKFRHLLEKHSIGEKLFADVSARLDEAGLIMHGGTVVDATLIAAAPSTKNKEKKRDPEMHQTKKGNEWHFGMKVHAGVDAGSGYVHTITGTSANVHDVTETVNLLREDDYILYGDSGYLGAPERYEQVKTEQNLPDITFNINKRPSSLKQKGNSNAINWEKLEEHRKSSVRCKVEHVFLIVKKYFGYAKVAYRGISKNMNRFNILFASANLVMCSRAGRTNEFCSVIG